jgi:L-asparaginase II
LSSCVPERYDELAVVVRSGIIESRHFGSLMAIASDGSTALTLGQVDEDVLPRSTYKPLQALAVLEAGLDLDSEQLAIAIGSHGGSNRHVEAVNSILDRYGLSEGLLRCPADYPEDEAERERMIREGISRRPICMNCSGKHAAMLAACQTNGWSTDNYLDPAHPLQQIVSRVIERVSATAVRAVAVDGCGAPLFSTSVAGVARAFRELCTAQKGTHEFSVAEAMRTHPFLIGGHRQANTVVMTVFPGSLAKGGAEGVLGMATKEGASVGVKVIDGGLRATTVIALAALEKIGALPAGSRRAHVDLAVGVHGGGRLVGSIEPGQALSF